MIIQSNRPYDYQQQPASIKSQIDLIRAAANELTFKFDSLYIENTWSISMRDRHHGLITHNIKSYIRDQGELNVIFNFYQLERQEWIQFRGWSNTKIFHPDKCYLQHYLGAAVLSVISHFIHEIGHTGY